MMHFESPSYLYNHLLSGDTVSPKVSLRLSPFNDVFTLSLGILSGTLAEETGYAGTHD